MAALEELFQSHRAGPGFRAGYRRRGDDIAQEFERLEALTEGE
ncbi:MAG TPA: hypothetical protein VFA44_15715 [Gaiellaceae bacterium]|nr:hypothetical protein [Gaiellaceae bacterium]